MVPIHLAVVIPPSGLLESCHEIAVKACDVRELIVIVNARGFLQFVLEKGETHSHVIDVLNTAVIERVSACVCEVAGSCVCGRTLSYVNHASHLSCCLGVGTQ